MKINDFFLLGPPPANAMEGSYDMGLVALSCVMAVLASFVVLDITERLRTSDDEDSGSKTWWLVGGALTMGLGIWTMHFIGMLAFIMPMPMDYDPELTSLSLAVAVVASAFAFYLIKNKEFRLVSLITGGIFLGFGIVSMHYIGMEAMMNVNIHYMPGLFLLSILIAIAASEAALWLMIKSCERTSYHGWLKSISAMVMGLAICGMHYTGVYAAVITESPTEAHLITSTIHPTALSIYIAATTMLIILIALAASRFWLNALVLRNKKLVEAEAILERQSAELQVANKEIAGFAREAMAKEQRIRAILTAAADGIIVTDEVGVIEECNRAAAEIFGYPTDEITSKNIDQFIGQMQENANAPFLKITFASLLNNTEPAEYRGLRSDKTIIPIELTVSQSEVNEKKLCIIVFRDITDRKKAQEELSTLNNQLVTAARMAGMAEVAMCMLHNVGNVLNSVNVSAQLLLNRKSDHQVSALAQVAKLLEQNKADLATFIKKDPVGTILAEYLQRSADYWASEQQFQQRELQSLHSKVQHIKNIVAMQQSLSGGANVTEKQSINELIDDALEINSEFIDRHKIQIQREYEEMPPVELDRVKTLQTIVNLIKNAIESVLISPAEAKTIIVRTRSLDEDQFAVEVVDNGVGIKQADLNRIFNYGFTTKKSGHGFGLHSSALSAQEVGGSLKAYSQGENQGATFVLILPKQIQQRELVQTVDK